MNNAWKYPPRKQSFFAKYGEDIALATICIITVAAMGIYTVRAVEKAAYDRVHMVMPIGE